MSEPPKVRWSTSLSKLGKVLQAFAWSMGCEIRRAVLSLRGLKVRWHDLRQSQYRLGKEYFESREANPSFEADRAALEQLEAQAATLRSEIALPSAGGGFKAKAMATIQRLRRRFALLILHRHLRRRYTALGRRVAATPSEAMTFAELAAVHRVHARITSLAEKRSAIPAATSAQWLGAAAIFGAMAFLVLSSAAVCLYLFQRSSLKPGETHQNQTASSAHSTSSSTASAEKKGNASDPRAAEELVKQGTAAYHAGDLPTAVRQFTQAAAMGHSGAQLQLGWFYENGAGVPQDYSTAAHWYHEAAEHGDRAAMKNLGQLYENGQGVPEDWPEAARWYQKSAELGYPYGEAALGRAYQFGIGVPQSREVSSYWNERAFAHGDESCEQWVRWLRDPTNNIGFRNPDEQALVLGNQLRTSGLLLGADPVGWMFHDSAERLAWLRGLRNAVDADEAESRRQRATYERQQAESSRKRHESEVQRLRDQGYSREAAESKAGW